MVDLNKLTASLQTRRAPVEKWDPPFCGDLDIVITSDGRWLYNGSVIQRPQLVQLFASVLKREGEDYFLVTPVEKVRIQVEDLPFVITRWYRQENSSVINVIANTDEIYLLSTQFPLCMVRNLPAVKVRDGFLARVHRNVYYQWAEIAEPAAPGEKAGYYLQSGEARFWLGPQS